MTIFRHIVNCFAILGAVLVLMLIAAGIEVLAKKIRAAWEYRQARVRDLERQVKWLEKDLADAYIALCTDWRFSADKGTGEIVMLKDGVPVERFHYWIEAIERAIEEA